MKAVKRKQIFKQKRIVAASLLLAAVIIAGTTFAWFASQDSVTNRLTARTDYGVSITEDFTPPEDWAPGQEINKDVGAVNTGNISAFVKLTLSNALEVSCESETPIANVTFDNGVPSVETTTGNESTKLTVLSAAYEKNEVLATQAGGYLVAAYTANGKITYTSNGTDKTVALGKMRAKYNIYTETTDVNGDTVYELNDDSKAPAAGYYIFRNEKDTSGVWQYSGFYYDGTDYYKINVTCTKAPDYGTDGNTVTDADGNGIADGGAFTVSFAAKETVSAAEPTLAYDPANNRFIATYDVKQNDSDTNVTNPAEDNIVFYIKLADDAVGTADDAWTYGGLDGESKKAYFYLNKLLEPGITSKNLINSIELSSDIKEGAYANLTYDLNVDLDSVQVVYKQDTATGKTKIDTENSAAAAKSELLRAGAIGTGDYAFDTVTVTVTDEDNIKSASVGWKKK